MDERLNATINLFDSVSTKVLNVSIKFYYTMTKTGRSKQSLADCSITQNLYVCFSPPQHGEHHVALIT